MASGQKSSPSKGEGSSPRKPTPKKVSISSTDRLSTITERISTPTPAPPIPRKSSQRRSTLSPLSSIRPGSPRTWLESRRSSHDTGKSAPPAYDWIPDPPAGEERGNPPVEGEKLAELRRDEGWRRPRRGGWGRLALIVGVIFLAILALAVGLGVGLSQRKKSSSSESTTSPDSGEPPQDFPLGQYSFITALMGVQQACTSNLATWRCSPYTQFNPSDGSSDTSSLAYFNWAISATSSTYATTSIQSTPDSGIPANLTVTSNIDPFGTLFGPKDLTYIASSANSSAARYTFSFTTAKKIVPYPPITSDGSNAVCFFNETVFTGTIYLSASRNYPSNNLAKSTTLGGFQQWPHAVEVVEVADSGNNVPDCYETKNGDIGAPIADITPAAAGLECSCDYRNYY